ncbi:MAG: alpha/beta fold hydrolase [Actinomycetota bacterium]|nr:alpha/beta fold hydrolase [Actinomycetota bacterium]
MKIRNIVGSIVASLAAVAAAAGGLSWWLSRRGGPIESVLGGDNQVWQWRDYDINFASAGEGRPIVFIHGMYPGASNAQWESNFSALSKQFKVFAPDLLGFGRSSRPALAYSPDLYKDLIADFLKEIVEQPAIVVAGGQSAPFVIDVAASDPKLISRLVLDSPTGLTRFAGPAPMGQRLAYRWSSLPVVGTLTYFAMVSKRQISRRLRTETVEDPSLITPSADEDMYRETHQPGAKWAPMAVSGGQLNVDIRSSYAKLTQPILILWGEMPSSIPVSDAQEFLDANENAVLQAFPDARSMPEFEHPSKFNAHVQMWAEGKLAA